MMIERIAARAVARLGDAIVAAAADELPGIIAERTDGGVVLRGPGLALRWITDARLRGLAWIARDRAA